MPVGAIHEEPLSDHHMLRARACPWCGKKTALYFRDDQYGEATKVICMKCEVHGPPAEYEELEDNDPELPYDPYAHAVRKWNQRA